MTAPFDTTLLRQLADAGVRISRCLRGVCDGDLTARETWQSCDDYAEELTRILQQLKTVRILAWETDKAETAPEAYAATWAPYRAALDANLRRMSGRDLAEARALSRVVVEGACEL